MRVRDKPWVLLAAITVFPAASLASTVNLVPVYANESTGTSFLLSVTYSYNAMDGFGKLTWVFENTSPNPPISASFLTGFAWDSPTGVTYAMHSSTHSSFALEAPAGASPFGTYSHALALGGDWLGGGSPNGGIESGDTGTFVLKVMGTSGVLAGLTTDSFLSDRTYTTGGVTYPAPIAVRLRGIQPGDGSDKILGAAPGGPGPGPLIPTPTAALAGAVGLVGLMMRRAHR